MYTSSSENWVERSIGGVCVCVCECVCVCVGGGGGGGGGVDSNKTIVSKSTIFPLLLQKSAKETTEHFPLMVLIGLVS